MGRKMRNTLLALVFILGMLPSTSFASEKGGLDSHCAKIMEVLASQDASQEAVGTGIVLGSIDEVRALNSYFKNLYYNGNVGVCFSGGTYDGTEVTVYVKTNGPSRQAYEEHVRATEKYQAIADAIPGTGSQETLDRIYDYVYTNVTYADANTVNTIKQARNSSQINFQDIQATGYTAVMEGVSTCVGYSTMFQRLCRIKGISCSIIKNSSHQYNLVKLNGREMCYDITSDTVCREKYLYSGESYEYLVKLNSTLYEAAEVIS